MNDRYHRLSRLLGHEFRESALLLQALTHRSHSHVNNERLEFLGDGLINFAVAAALYEACPRAEEGGLSRLRASLVREESLARIARELALGDMLKLGESELKSGGFRRDSILADALEALIGAVYLDAGYAAAQAVCLRLYAVQLAALPDPETLKDPKTRLQEWLQKLSRPLPRYEVLSEEGPPHQRVFAVRCHLVDSDETTEASGASRRQAEQGAAEQLLEKLNGISHA
ncbi:MAG: ribonuclease III [Stenotrophobium sp.]